MRFAISIGIGETSTAWCSSPPSADLLRLLRCGGLEPLNVTAYPSVVAPGASEQERQLDQLRSGPLHRFKDWPNAEASNARAGVYTVWDTEGRFVYVGMWGRGVALNGPAKFSTRLASHAAWRRSGDQFCVYVADWLVLPTLTAEQITEIGLGRLQVDALVRAYIRDRLAYRFIATEDGKQAYEVEDSIKRGALGERPLLNPARNTRV